jgi:glycosyltransferase involved in cell wall biosynthesis
MMEEGRIMGNVDQKDNKLKIRGEEMEDKIDISILIPVFNEERNVGLLYSRLKLVVDKLNKDYEIIFINDGSTDGTEDELRRLKAVDEKIKCIMFRGNFKKAAAYSAGLRFASGQTIVTMDGDLQDDPEELPKFLDKIDDGYDYVSGWKYKGKGNPYRAWPSKIFNSVVKKVNKLDLHDFNCPFKAFKRSVIDPDEIYGELYRFLPVLAKQKGYKIGEVRVENFPRIHGRSKYGLERFLRGFFDSLTILFLTRYYKRPLHFFGTIGLILLFLGSLSIITLYSIKFLFGILIQNTPFLFGLSLMSMVLGVQFFSMGLLSELIINLNKKPGDGYVIKEIL